MNISIFYDHVKTVHINEKKDINALIDALKARGVSGFDLGWSEIAGRSEFVASELKKWGFCAASIYAIFDFSRGFDPAKINDLILDAHNIRSKSVLIVPGFLPQQCAEEALKNMLGAISYACDVAHQYGISVMVEDFDDLRSPTVSIEGLDYFFGNEPRLKFNLDTGNFCCVNDNIFEAIDRFGDKIAHVHLKDRSLVPQETVYVTHCADGKVYYPAICGDGLMQIKEVIEKLSEISYNGYLSLEYFGEPESDKIFKSLDFLKTYTSQKNT